MNFFQALALVLGLLALASASLYLPYRVEMHTVATGETGVEPQRERTYAPLWNAPQRGYDPEAKVHIGSVEVDVGRLLATYAVILPVTILLFAAGYAIGDLDEQGPAVQP